MGVITTFADVTNSIWFLCLLLICVISLLFIAFTIAKFLVKIGKDQRTDHFDYQNFKKGQDQTNEVVLSGILQLNETTSVFLKFMQKTEDHMAHTKNRKSKT